MAFAYCSSLTSVAIPSRVNGIGDSAFFACRALTNLTLKGNAPDMGSSAFGSVGSGCTAYVKRGSTGWGVDIPGTWQGVNIRYLTPEVDIAAANEAGGGTVEVDAGELTDV